jgi:UDP-N-acetyl-D-glucosamine dehydrogenase
MATQYSISPEGDQFPLPTPDQYPAEFDRLKRITDRQRAEGKEIVVVVGVGFVGAVMAAVVADSKDKRTGKHNKFVIG